jgi:hypothetical protein
LFYDALQEYGDWTLIEPHGFVFRPRSTFARWQPYSDGFWVPTDLYGWVWVSAEPFGWATYHYGQWFHDDFQGWVWLPGVQWAPAWVDWRANDSYVGWAPLAPRGARVPEDAYRYVPASQLGSTNLRDYAMSARQLGETVAGSRPIENLDRVEGGTVFNRGPSLAWVERRRGALLRSKVEDLVPQAVLRSPGAAGKDEEWARKPDGTLDTTTVLKTAAERAARRALELSRGEAQIPQYTPMVRPFGVPALTDAAAPAPPPPPRPRPKRKGAAADSTRRR